MSPPAPGGPAPAAPNAERRAAIDQDRLPHYLGYALRRAQARVFQDFARHVAGLDITPGQFGLLTLIRANPGLSQTDLAQAVGLDKSTVAPAVKVLAARGLIERLPSAGDRRLNALTLTPAGLALHDELRRRVEAHDRHVGRCLSPDERRVLHALLARLVEA